MLVSRRVGYVLLHLILLSPPAWTCIGAVLDLEALFVLFRKSTHCLEINRQRRQRKGRFNSSIRLGGHRIDQARLDQSMSMRC